MNNEKPKNIIYGLVDPITNELRYIGQSSVGIRRAQKHCWSYYLRPDTKNGKHSHKQRWLLKLIKEYNKKPEIVIIEILENKSDLNGAEIFYIQYFKKIGCPLTNTALGGNLSIPPPPRPKGYKHSKETCELLSKINKERKIIYTPEYRKKLSLARLGKKFGPPSQETRDKIAKANTGKKHSLEVIEKLKKIKEKVSIKLIDQFGNIYSSICDAARKTGAFKVSIRGQLKGLNYSCNGYIFKKLNAISTT